MLEYFAIDNNSGTASGGGQFNVFDFVNFTGISLSLSNPKTFGEFSFAQDAGVLQLAIRYSF
ncbi:MAG: hypothetical protein QOJ99_2408 [Bryobacterales bacterium]|nr:hypothetical protein [Bryobacterales bacterium]